MKKTFQNRKRYTKIIKGKKNTMMKISNDPLLCVTIFDWQAKTCLQELTANFQIIYFSMLKQCLYNKTTMSNGGKKLLKENCSIYLFLDRLVALCWVFFWQAAKLSLARHRLLDDIGIDSKCSNTHTNWYRQNWKFHSQ